MNSDIEMLSNIAAGYKRAAERLESLRIQDIRESDTASAIRSLELAYRSIMNDPIVRKNYPLSAVQRRFFGVDI